MLVGIMNSRRSLTLGCGVLLVLAQFVPQPWVGLPKDASAILYTQEMASTADDWVAEGNNVSVDGTISTHILNLTLAQHAGNDTSTGTTNDSPNTNTSTRSTKPWAALCAVMRDEDRYIDEWVDYHLALGFEQVHIYDSHPNFTLAQWYEKRLHTEDTNDNSNTIDRIHLSHRVLPDTGTDAGKVQEIVYGECIEHLRSLPNPPKWVMVLDGDEFLVFRNSSNTTSQYSNVVDFLTEHLQSGSLQINWITMGSSKETTYRDEPVTKRFQYAISGDGFPETKAVAVLDHIVGWKVHYVFHKPGYDAIGMGGRRVGLRGALCCIKNGDVSVAAIYHYKYKSEEEFNYKNCVRGDIYKFVKSKCPVTATAGDVYDDGAWQAMKRLLPKKYASHAG
jgi:Glycosyl transferase family 2